MKVRALGLSSNVSSQITGASCPESAQCYSTDSINVKTFNAIANKTGFIVILMGANDAIQIELVNGLSPVTMIAML